MLKRSGMRKFLKNWWEGLKYDPGDPRFFAGRDVKIAAIGGGTGLSRLLRGLKHYSSQITAVVAVTDNGRSSGALRKEFDMLPPGDIRQCISALAHDEELVSKVLEHRFIGQNGFSGHTLGNIWLAGLTQYFDSFEKAVEATTEIFNTAGKVVPATLESADLKAEYDNGEVRVGESEITYPGAKIKKIEMTGKAKAYGKAVEAISAADLILLGPGSLYTSVIPNLLIPEIKQAVAENKSALKIYIANCSTERGVTENYDVLQHIEAVEKYAGKNVFKFCLANNKLIKQSSDVSKLGEVNNIAAPGEAAKNCLVIKEDLIDETAPLYHDSEKLAAAVFSVYKKYKENRIHSAGALAGSRT